MLIRASGALTEDLFLLTLGASARYLLKTGPEQAILFDPGCSAQLPALLERLTRIGIMPRHITNIFITRVAADTVAATLALRALNPSIKVIGAKSHRSLLQLRWAEIVKDDSLLCALMPGSVTSPLSAAPPELFDQHLADGECYSVSSDYAVRCLSAAGFTDHSCCYLVEPLRTVVVDLVGGYFRGKAIPAPAADYSLEASNSTLQTLQHLDIATLCLPFGGALCGDLVQRHLAALDRALRDVVSESTRASKDGVQKEDIFSQIKLGLFADGLPDPLLQRALLTSLEQLWRQLLPRLESTR